MLADALIERGWHGLACYPDSKRPASPHGVLDATNDPASLRRHFSEHPRDNLAIATGPSGLVVVDLDVRTADGFANFADLCERHGHGWPHTRTVSTPSGGSHLYFTARRGETIPSNSSRLAPAVDIKSRGGYVLCEPSTIRLARYRVTLDVEPVGLPGWILDATSSRRLAAVTTVTGRCQMGGQCRYGHAVLRRLADEIATTPEGRREVTVYGLARRIGAFVTTGCLHHDHAAAVLADAAIRTGLDRGEALAAIAGGFASRQAAAGAWCPFTRKDPST